MTTGLECVSAPGLSRRAQQLLAPQPTDILIPTGQIRWFLWNGRGVPSGFVVLIPGWGGHPLYYRQLVVRLQESGFEIIATWSRSDLLTTDAHLRAVGILIEYAHAKARQRGLPVSVVADSLGVSYALASNSLSSVQSCVLIAPPTIVSRRHVLARVAWRDNLTLLLQNRLPLLGWRLEDVTQDEAYLELFRSERFTAPFADSGFIARAILAVGRSFLTPSLPSRVWVVQPIRDPLFTRTGQRLFEHRLRLCRKSSILFSYVESDLHGMFWQPSIGVALSAQISEFLSAGRCSSQGDA